MPAAMGFHSVHSYFLFSHATWRHSMPTSSSQSQSPSMFMQNWVSPSLSCVLPSPWCHLP